MTSVITMTTKVTMTRHGGKIADLKLNKGRQMT